MKGGRDVNSEEAARLARTYGPAVYRMAYARTGNRSDAEDVMQEVFLTLLRKGPEHFREEGHARAWLLRVTAQRSCDLFRSLARRRELPLEEAADTPTPVEGRGETLEAVLALPAELRLPVHLFYYEGMTVEEVARTLGIGESAVKTRLFRARAKLREELTKGGEDLVP